MTTVTALAVSGPACTAGGCLITSFGWHQFTATATLADGSTVNLSNRATWASTDPAVAAVNADGLVSIKDVGTADVTAVYQGKMGGQTVTVAYPTRIMALSGDLAFGNVGVGSTATRVLTIGNTGNTTLPVHDIIYPSGFSGAWTGGVPPGGTQTVAVTFAPTRVGSYAGWLVVAGLATGGRASITVSGYGSQTAVAQPAVPRLEIAAETLPNGLRERRALSGNRGSS